MSKKIDGDLSALKGARKALLKSSSRRMLRANLEFLLDYFWYHPSDEIPECLRSNKACTGLADTVALENNVEQPANQ